MSELEDWARRNREKMVSRALRLLGRREEAEDVVQDTLAALHRKASEGGVRDLTRYALRAVTLNALKRRARLRDPRPLREADLAAEARGADEEDSLDPATLERAIAGLPLPQQAVIRMRYYTGMTFRQIGLALSISQHTVAGRCRYALANLRRILKAACGKDKS